MDGHKPSDKIETDCIWVSPEKKKKNGPKRNCSVDTDLKSFYKVKRFDHCGDRLIDI